jgi:RNA polymerase-binding protein DksA
MISQKLDHFKLNLLEMEREILSNIESESVEEENPFEVDGDLVDRAEAFNSASVIEGLSSSQKKTIDEIRRALQRIKDHTFGKCTVCGTDIESERLEAIPYADKCKKHMNAAGR